MNAAIHACKGVPPVDLIVVWALHLPEVVPRFGQRMLAERRQLQMWSHMLLAHRHLTLQAGLDGEHGHSSGFPLVASFLRNAGRRRPVRHDTDARRLGGDRGAVVTRHGERTSGLRH